MIFSIFLFSVLAFLIFRNRWISTPVQCHWFLQSPLMVFLVFVTKLGVMTIFQKQEFVYFTEIFVSCSYLLNILHIVMAFINEEDFLMER